jgi:hypothetical protein
MFQCTVVSKFRIISINLASKKNNDNKTKKNAKCCVPDNFDMKVCGESYLVGFNYLGLSSVLSSYFVKLKYLSCLIFK